VGVSRCEIHMTATIDMNLGVRNVAWYDYEEKEDDDDVHGMPSFQHVDIGAYI
jgi:hypothetical protein